MSWLRRCALQTEALVTRGRMNRRKWGLYGKKYIRFGNNVSHSERRTRRIWKPNVQTKRVYSDVLGEWIKFKMTTHAMRCISKAGGIDNYLLSKKRKDQDSVIGEKVKNRILKVLKEREKNGEAPAMKAL